MEREAPRLREVGFGEWEGLTREEIDARYSRAFREWDACKLAAPTGGETDLEMADRVLAALREIAERHEDACVLVVTSGGPFARRAGARRGNRPGGRTTPFRACRQLRHDRVRR